MPLNKTSFACSYRIALVIDNSGLAGHRLLTGLCRRATAYPNLMVHRYFEDALTKEGLGIDPLVGWNPDAVVIYGDNIALLKKLRQALPQVPVVAMSPLPLDLVDAIVAGSAPEIIELSLDHFSQNGLTDFALFHPNPEEAANIQAETFRTLLRTYPGTFGYFQRNLSAEELLSAPTGETLEEIGSWLQSLPKPVGIYCPVDHAAAYLIRICKHIGLAVPENIQVIGCDELDESLECSPHVTSIHIPSERIGAAALKTVISLLQGKRPEAKVQTLEGSSLIPQGSTGIIPNQLSNIPAAIAYIESNAVQGASVDDVVLATQRASRMTFYRDFKKQVGDSPAHYIRRIRLEAACRLLTTTQMDITHIAELTGFSSSNYFAQIFRRENGMTPNKYREAHSNS